MKLRGARADELADIAQLSARAFTREFTGRVNSFLDRHSGPRARPDLARVLEADGLPRASVRIQDHNIELGRARLRLAGIADVGTDPQQRGKGYASRLMSDTVRYMTETGFDVTLLFGIRDFYDRFGYIVAMPRYNLSISVTDAQNARRTLRARPCRPADLPPLKRIYRQNGRSIWCNAVRDKVDWQFRNHRFDNARVLLDGKKLVGYSVYNFTSNSLDVSEIGAAENPAVYESLLADLARVADEHSLERIQVQLPYDHPAVVAFADFGADLSLHYPRNSGGMARILNFQSTIEKMLQQWGAQLSESGLRSRIEFRIETDLGECALRFNRGRLALLESARPSLRLELPQTRLTQLLFGYQPAEFICAKPDVKCSSDLLPVMNILFPQRHAFIWPHDHF